MKARIHTHTHTYTHTHTRTQSLTRTHTCAHACRWALNKEAGQAWLPSPSLPALPLPFSLLLCCRWEMCRSVGCACVWWVVSGWVGVRRGGEGRYVSASNIGCLRIWLAKLQAVLHSLKKFERIQLTLSLSFLTCKRLIRLWHWFSSRGCSWLMAFLLLVPWSALFLMVPWSAFFFFMVPWSVLNFLMVPWSAFKICRL